ncbi:SGNH/GDSL hydrolase family protein [Mucilaginibacter koreensis]
MKRFLSKLFAFGTIASAVLSVNAHAQTVPRFKAGDRVVFTGNSITDGGHYHSYIWLYYLTRFPGMRIQIYNSGIGGDVARQIDERLEDDVFAKHPNVIALTFGMNDTGYQYLTGPQADAVYNEKIETAYYSFQNIERKLLAYQNANIIMIGSSPYDETSKIKTRALTGKNEAMLKIAAFQQQAAKAHHWSFVDFNQPMLTVNKAQQQTDSLFTLQGTDRIHPTNDGHMVMAYAFLKAQGFSGKKVAALNINAGTKAVQTENCTVSNLKVGSSDLSFDYLAKALPYPTDTVRQGNGRQARSQADAMKLIPFVKEFNQEDLKLSGLKASQNYELRIDGISIGKWNGNQFQQGINLALYASTPQYQQALAVMHLNEERWQLERRLREYYWLHYSILKPKGLLYNDQEPTADSLEKYAKKDFFVAVTLPTYRKARFKSVRDAWQKEIALLTNELYRINQPQPHHFTVEAVKP